jgi:hypothetical protein
MIELTQEQRRALATAGEAPPLVVDPETKAAYVLVPKEWYERLSGTLNEDDVRLMARLLADLDPEDWEDLSVYDEKP